MIQFYVLPVGPPNIIPGVPFPGCVPNVPSGGFPVSIAFPGYGGPGANPFGPSIPGPPVPPPPGNFYGGSNPFTPGFNPLLPPTGYPPVQLPNVCPQFPNNCKPNCRNPDFSPLVDVPYCQRWANFYNLNFLFVSSCKIFNLCDNTT